MKQQIYKNITNYEETREAFALHWQVIASCITVRDVLVVNIIKSKVTRMNIIEMKFNFCVHLIYRHNYSTRLLKL
jgi:hypothetical protein